jgi:fatty acid desaturase
MGCGALICKIALWCGASDVWAVLSVFIIGVLWEVYEVIVEGTHEVYGTKQKWMNNTISDLVVETGLAAWMVLPV